MPNSSLLGTVKTVAVCLGWSAIKSPAKYGSYDLSRAASDWVQSPLPRLIYTEPLNCRTLQRTSPQQLVRYSREVRHLLSCNAPKLPSYMRMLTSSGASEGSSSGGDRAGYDLGGQVKSTNRGSHDSGTSIDPLNPNYKSNNNTVEDKVGEVQNFSKEFQVPAPKVLTKTDLDRFENRMNELVSKLFSQLSASQSHQVISKVQKISDVKVDFENPLPLTMIVDEQNINKRLNGIQRSIDKNFRVMASLRKSNKRSRSRYVSCVPTTSKDKRFDNSDPRGGSTHQNGDKDLGESIRTSKRQKIGSDGSCSSFVAAKKTMKDQVESECPKANVKESTPSKSFKNIMKAGIKVLNNKLKISLASKSPSK